MARRLGVCRISFLSDDPEVTSRWTSGGAGLEISLGAAGMEDHDIAMELLVCLGQALWERLSASERRTYWGLLDREISAGIEGEIDEQAQEEKCRLLASLENARNLRRLESYGRASFAGTAAEYVHSLWHNVTVREGPEHLPPAQLKRRLELLASWFPPDRGYRLYPAHGSRFIRRSTA